MNGPSANSDGRPGRRLTPTIQHSGGGALAEARIDLFMSDVLIAAASTNAVVICCALQGWCALSESFTRMYSLVRARYPGRPPFTVISATQVCVAYHHLFRPLLSSWRVLLLPSL